MKLQLNQAEIENAVRDHLATGINLKGKSLSVAFSMGKGTKGLSAQVDIEDSTLPDLPASTSEVRAALADTDTSNVVALHPADTAAESPVSTPDPEPVVQDGTPASPKTASLFS